LTIETSRADTGFICVNVNDAGKRYITLTPGWGWLFRQTSLWRRGHEVRRRQLPF